MNPVELAEPSAGDVVRRSPWWLELGILAGGYWLYSWIADHAPRGSALAHAEMILRFERVFGIDDEHAANHWWTSFGHPLIVFGNLYYDLLHFIVPVATIVWVYFFRHNIYRRVRSVLVIVSLAALAFFWLWPVAPPRLVPGLGVYDTIARVHTLVGGGSHGITAAENPFAAFPSLHVAWATWAAYAVWCSTRSRVWRGLVVANVLVMSYLVMATGNHWISDVVAGAAGVGLAVLMSYAGSWLVALVRQRSASAGRPGPANIVDARR